MGSWSNLISTTVMIDSLVKWKYPFYRSLSAPRPLGSRISKDIVVRKEKIMKEVKAYKKELNALPREKLVELYEHEKAKSLQKAKEEDEREEQQRFFNLKSADADFVHWSKASYWSLEEAVALVLGKSPEVVTWKSVQEYKRISPFAKEYSLLRDLALRAKEYNQLGYRVFPGVFLAWAERMDVDIPKELLVQVSKRGIQIADWKNLYDKRSEECELLKRKFEYLSQEQEERKAIRNGEHILVQSNYWCRLEELTEKAVLEYRAWSKNQKYVQKSGNLQEWLTGTIGTNNREAEIIKKVMSDIFKDLK